MILSEMFTCAPVQILDLDEGERHAIYCFIHILRTREDIFWRDLVHCRIRSLEILNELYMEENSSFGASGDDPILRYNASSCLLLSRRRSSASRLNVRSLICYNERACQVGIR